MQTLAEFIIISLAVWRLSNMIVDDSEDGPYDVLHLIRFFLGERGASPDRRYIFEERSELNFWWNFHYQVYRSSVCIWCMSVWVGLFFTIIYLIEPFITMVIAFPFSLSAGALIVNRWMKYG